MRVQMLGLCRWSYLGLRGYQVDHATLAARRDYLYDPDRLVRRWLWFTTIALPGWLAQTDPDFTLVVMTGPDLPHPYLSRLLNRMDEPRAGLGILHRRSSVLRGMISVSRLSRLSTIADTSRSTYDFTYQVNKYDAVFRDPVLHEHFDGFHRRATRC